MNYETILATIEKYLEEKGDREGLRLLRGAVRKEMESQVNELEREIRLFETFCRVSDEDVLQADEESYQASLQEMDYSQEQLSPMEWKDTRDGGFVVLIQNSFTEYKPSTNVVQVYPK